METILFFAIIFLLIYFFVIEPRRYWTSRNIPIDLVIPFLGDNFYMASGSESVAEMIQRVYNRYAGARYLGSYQFRTPVLVLKSPELIKQLCVKNFLHSTDHRALIPEGVEDLWSNNLIALKGKTWKRIRSILSTAFSTKRIKLVFLFMRTNANLYTKHFMTKKQKEIEVDLNDVFSRYATDVISNFIFSVHNNSLEEKRNQIYLIGQSMSLTSRWRIFMLVLYQIIPSLEHVFPITLFDKRVGFFFNKYIQDIVRFREERNIKCTDLLGKLIEAKTGTQSRVISTSIKKDSNVTPCENTKTVSEIELSAQIFIFFLGGIETTSTTMCFMAYELASNPDIQRKLIEEIDEIRQAGELTYEKIGNMTYLDMVLCETLRKWPNQPATDRVITRPYTIQPELPGEIPVHLEEGIAVLVPIYALHHDSKYYEDPDKFDPERFSSKNRNNINPWTYLPFGVGPRKCIAHRFAILSMKTLFFHILSEFEIIPIDKTPNPMKLKKACFCMTSENGFHVGFKRRNFS